MTFLFPEARDQLRLWREENERRSLEVVDMWDNDLQSNIHKLGDESLYLNYLFKFLIIHSSRINIITISVAGLLVWEQVCIAALDCNRMDVVDICLVSLATEFPSSMRVRRLQAMKLEALEKYAPN